MYSLREGKITDLPRVFELIQELALYEKAPEQVTNTVERMEKEGFGAQPVYGCYVCEKKSNQEIIGIAVYYYRYSTWKGKRLYLEDIIVTESERGNGAGKLLFEKVMAKSLEEDCSGMMWQVLDWNEPAIHFYKKYGAFMEAGWLNAHLQEQEIRTFLERKGA
jgi:GNAT superfamily N-acetyltransferase